MKRKRQESRTSFRNNGELRSKRHVAQRKARIDNAVEDAAREGTQNPTVAVTFRSRCTPSKLVQMSNKFSDGDVKRQIIVELGFGGLLDIKFKLLNIDLCRFLIEHFDADSCSFNMPGFRLKISEKDVNSILGLNCDGEEIVCKGNVEDLEEKYKSFWVRGRTKIKSLERFLFASEVSSIEDFKACATLYFIAVFISPTASVYVPPRYLNLVRDVNNIARLNWGKHLVEKLCTGINRWKQGKHRYISGCIAFLMLFYFDNLKLGNIVAPISSRSSPRCKVWDHKTIKALRSMLKARGGYMQPSDTSVQSCEGTRDLPTVDKGKGVRNVDYETELKALRDGFALSAQGYEKQLRALKEEVTALGIKLDNFMTSITEELLPKLQRTIVDELTKFHVEAHETRNFDTDGMSSEPEQPAYEGFKDGEIGEQTAYEGFEDGEIGAQPAYEGPDEGGIDQGPAYEDGGMGEQAAYEGFEDVGISVVTIEENNLENTNVVAEWPHNSLHEKQVLEDEGMHRDSPKEATNTGIDVKTFNKNDLNSYKSLTLEDIKPMEFSSRDEAESFYKMYAISVGFSFRRQDMRRKKDGNLSMQRWVCNRQGTSADKDKDGNKEHPTKQNCTKKLGCPATFRVNLDSSDGKWKVRDIVTAHNHELVSKREGVSL